MIEAKVHLQRAIAGPVRPAYLLPGAYLRLALIAKQTADDELVQLTARAALAAEEAIGAGTGVSSRSTHVTYPEEDRPMMHETQGGLTIGIVGGMSPESKHFSSELAGWEEKDRTVDFPLVAASANELRFEGLVFTRQDDGKVRVALMQKDRKTGEDKEVVFILRPKSLARCGEYGVRAGAL